MRLARPGRGPQGRPEAGLPAGHGRPRGAHRGRRRPGRARWAGSSTSCFGLPAGHHRREWAVGMKVVVDLPEDSTSTAGTVLHTFGFPEPEIFGFLYVHPDRVASLGIFVPSWFDSPIRTAYRYLQHWMQHPYALAPPRGRHAPLLGRQVAARVGPARRAAPGRRRLRPHRRGLRAAPTSSPAPAWTRPGPPACSWPRACSSCSKPGQPFTRREPGARLRGRGAARAGWRREGRVAEKARDGFQQGVVPGSWAWRWPA